MVNCIRKEWWEPTTRKFGPNNSKKVIWCWKKLCLINKIPKGSGTELARPVYGKKNILWRGINPDWNGWWWIIKSNQLWCDEEIIRLSDAKKMNEKWGIQVENSKRMAWTYRGLLVLKTYKRWLGEKKETAKNHLINEIFSPKGWSEIKSIIWKNQDCWTCLPFEWRFWKSDLKDCKCSSFKHFIYL